MLSSSVAASGAFPVMSATCAHSGLSLLLSLAELSWQRLRVRVPSSPPFFPVTWKEWHPKLEPTFQFTSRNPSCKTQAFRNYPYGVALKILLKLERYCRKTRIHNTQATSAGGILAGAIVR